MWLTYFEQRWTGDDRKTSVQVLFCFLINFTVFLFFEKTCCRVGDSERNPAEDFSTPCILFSQSSKFLRMLEQVSQLNFVQVIFVNSFG